jgi:hypothetical protein
MILEVPFLNIESKLNGRFYGLVGRPVPPHSAIQEGADN